MEALDNDNLRLSGKQAIFYVLYGSFCEMLGFLMGVSLALFLRQMHNHAAVTLITPEGTIEKTDSFFTNKFYMLATGLVPPTVNLFFHIRAENDKSIANGTVPSCMDHPSLYIMSQKLAWQRYGEDHPSATRGFPVNLIFHIIATACCWFMDMQQSQQHNNLNSLEKLRKELTTARNETENKKKK